MEIDTFNLPRHNILTIDFKSYYASVECILRNLDPMTTYLAVVGDLSRKGSVCLASSPLMKRDYGIKTGSRLYEIPQKSGIHIVEARMNTYLDFAMHVPRIINRFVPLECISIYSIDEIFVTYDTQNLFGDNWTFARKLQEIIKIEMGLPTAVGMGDNILQSKVCLDILAKHNAETGFIDEVSYETFAHKIWPHPVRECWGIGGRMERNLARMGIYTIGDLANANLATMRARFGIIGEQLVMHSRGIDFTDPYHRPDLKNNAISQKGYGSGITLMRDYNHAEDVLTVILEQVEEVCRRARAAKMIGRTISLGIGYSSDVGAGGFNKARTIEIPTNITHKMFETCKQIFDDNYRNGVPVRNVHVSLNNLSTDEVVQLDLFEDDTKDRQLSAAMDSIRNKYGATSVTWARSLTDAGTSLDRAKKVGGHKA
jgi:DNA polymerase V